MLVGGAQSRDENGWRIYTEKEQDVAAMTMIGEELVIELVPPRDLRQFDKVKKFYTWSSERSGWLRYTRPATRDPKPDLAADLGSMLGAASWDRNKPPAFHPLASAGGPWICLPSSAVASWGGKIDKDGSDEFPAEYKLYRAALKCPVEGALFGAANGTQAVVLGSKDTLFWKPLDDGGVLARVLSANVDANALEKRLAELPSSGFQSIGELDVKEPYRAFDASVFGGAVAEGNSLTMELSPARYAVKSLTVKATKKEPLGLLLVRLEEIAPKKKSK